MTIGNIRMIGNKTEFQLYSIKYRNQRNHGNIYYIQVEVKYN